jgi:hypothetical protein
MHKLVVLALLDKVMLAAPAMPTRQAPVAAVVALAAKAPAV